MEAAEDFDRPRPAKRTTSFSDKTEVVPCIYNVVTEEESTSFSLVHVAQLEEECLGGPTPGPSPPTLGVCGQKTRPERRNE